MPISCRAADAVSHAYGATDASIAFVGLPGAYFSRAPMLTALLFTRFSSRIFHVPYSTISRHYGSAPLPRYRDDIEYASF